MIKKPEACIFDLDGVIVDTSWYHYKAWQRLAASLSIQFGEEENQQLKGLSRHDSMHKILEMGGRTMSEQQIQRLTDRKNEWYQEYIADLSPDNILEGIRPFLDELEDNDIRKAIGSSSKNAQQILEALQLTHRFDAVVDGDAVKNAKPDPEIFLRAAELLGVSPDACIVFEDAASGVKAANRAGMKSVGVGDKHFLIDADAVIPSFKNMTLDNILALLEK
ncbi:MAG TPA: beta-phosphoglucomutase [Balneolaceae bacterium]|nr:beta-phosphoglucomutase [Balneolaceae bacterium]